MNLKRVEPWSALAVVAAVHSAFLMFLSLPQLATSRGSQSGHGITVKFLVGQANVRVARVDQAPANDIQSQPQPESSDLNSVFGLPNTHGWETNPSGIRHFFSRNQVDEPALPLGDWQIQTDILPFDALSTIVFTAWVDDRGSITKWKIEDQNPQGGWTQPLLSQIAETKMQSAILNGQRVPSVATFEIGFDTRVLR